MAPRTEKRSTAEPSGVELIEQLPGPARRSRRSATLTSQPGRVTASTPAQAAARTTSSNAAPLASDQVQSLTGDLLLELGRGALGHDPAAVDDGDAVGQPVGLLQVLRGEEHGGHPDPAKLGDDLPHALAAGQVEAGRRLVEEDHRGLG